MCHNRKPRQQLFLTLVILQRPAMPQLRALSDTVRHGPGKQTHRRWASERQEEV